MERRYARAWFPPQPGAAWPRRSWYDDARCRRTASTWAYSAAEFTLAWTGSARPGDAISTPVTIRHSRIPGRFYIQTRFELCCPPRRLRQRARSVRPMREGVMGRVLVASLHQGIADVTPARLG